MFLTSTLCSPHCSTVLLRTHAYSENISSKIACPGVNTLDKNNNANNINGSNQVIITIEFCFQNEKYMVIFVNGTCGLAKLTDYVLLL